MVLPAIYDLYPNIILEALSVSKIKLIKCRLDFMIEIFMLYLSIPSLFNFLRLGRYSLFGEQHFRRGFEQEFDFFPFNKALLTPQIVSAYCQYRMFAFEAKKEQVREKEKQQTEATTKNLLDRVKVLEFTTSRERKLVDSTKKRK